MKLILIFLILFQMNQIQSDSVTPTFDVNQEQLTKISDTIVKIETLYFSPNQPSTTQTIYNKLMNDFFRLVWNIIWLILLFAILIWINLFINKLFDRYKLKEKFHNAEILKFSFQFLIMVIGILFILYFLFDRTIYLIYVIIFFLLLLIVIGSSSIVKNIFGGITVKTKKAFEIGDWIRIKNFYGKVKSIGLCTTELITEEDTLISIPNQIFLTDSIENLNVISKNKQVLFNVEISSSEEVTKIKNTIFEIVSLSIYNSINKPVEVIYKGTNDKGNYEFQIKAFVFDSQYESEFKSSINELLSEIFKVNK